MKLTTSSKKFLYSHYTVCRSNDMLSMERYFLILPYRKVCFVYPNGILDYLSIKED